MIRILQYGLSYNKGGVEAVIYQICKRIDPQKYCFDFLIEGDHIAYEEELISLGCKIYKIPQSHNPIQRLFIYYNFFNKYHSNFDIIHCSYNALYSITPVMFARVFGISKVIIHAHSNGHYSHKFYNIIRYQLNSKLIDFLATDFIACSDKAAKFIFSKARYDKKAYRVIYNPIAIQENLYSYKSREKMRRLFSISEDTFVIGHVGVFSPQKNHKFLFDIFSEIIKIIPNVKLLLVGGGDAQHLAQAHSYVKKKGIEKNVIFAGMRDDVSACLSSMDAFVFPSLYEGFGNAVVEAQISGLKCYISDNIDKRAVIVDKNVKRLSLYDNPRKWAYLISLDHFQYRRKIDVSIFYNFSIDNIVHRYYQLYNL